VWLLGKSHRRYYLLGAFSEEPYVPRALISQNFPEIKADMQVTSVMSPFVQFQRQCSSKALSNGGAALGEPIGFRRPLCSLFKQPAVSSAIVIRCAERQGAELCSRFNGNPKSVLALFVLPMIYRASSELVEAQSLARACVSHACLLPPP